MADSVKIVNVEEGLPDRAQATGRLESGLQRARKDGAKVLKIVHGYGSSGVGGILRPVVRNFLRQAKERGEIRLFVNGESFSSFDARSKELLAANPELVLDRDLGAGNKGITLVLL
jgi:Smr domain-containing protein